MRCESCNYCHYDYSDDMEVCWLGIDSYDNGKSCGCKYTQKTLDKWAAIQEKAEEEEYARMGEFFTKLGDKNSEIENGVSA